MYSPSLSRQAEGSTKIASNPSSATSIIAVSSISDAMNLLKNF